MKSHEQTNRRPNPLVCLLWLLVHTVFSWIEQLIRLVQRCRWKTVLYLQPSGARTPDSYRARLKESQLYVRQQLESASKIPKHLVVLLGPEQPDYHRLSQFIFWSNAAGIEYVSFYDHNGTMKRNHEEMKRYVDDTPLETAQHIIWSTSNYGSGKAGKNGKLRPTRRSTLVNFLSPEDGKRGLVCLSRSIGESVRRRDLHAADVSIELLDRQLQESSGFVPDPDLAIYFGEVCSTYGLLPWQIRLTEFLPLGLRLQDSTVQHFVSCLLRFAKCEQRLGT
uniref:ditrans,polycis-polyprenyl diphosphate synthase [(2E,6E)-farnesyldiphosphate specific] n=1 Tax=Anopheles epiroticus TaxID=199890 RepID=A0A182PT49_9DIPT